MKKQEFLNSLYIALQKKSDNESIVKKDTEFEGIEKYLRCKVKIGLGVMYPILTKGVLTEYGITEEEAWQCAEKNTFSETLIEPLEKFLIEKYHLTEEIHSMVSNCRFHIVTNLSEMCGASGILNTEAIKEYAKNVLHTNRIAMLPSSIHEVLIMALKEGEEKDYNLDGLVNEVNRTSVSPEEQLSDRAYIINI